MHRLQNLFYQYYLYNPFYTVLQKESYQPRIYKYFSPNNSETILFAKVILLLVYQGKIVCSFLGVNFLSFSFLFFFSYLFFFFEHYMS